MCRVDIRKCSSSLWARSSLESYWGYWLYNQMLTLHANTWQMVTTSAKQSGKQRESLWKHVPHRSGDWQRAAFSSLISLSQPSSRDRDSVETSGHTQLPPFKHGGRDMTSSHLPSAKHIVHRRCTRADCGAVMCSVFWTKMEAMSLCLCYVMFSCVGEDFHWGTDLARHKIMP